ncbi:ubiquitin-conjugating enzyme E2 J2-like [Stegodyphus dumicola]|uniref:ubiquitin-conjugating enzyme E2 J2-like n=1 Tax=Stegodyphus dumicola TaxID=202533 RepID=UPI0015A9620B|nr:ubiquitin-conjugating enzyme E2 J2-like [Stegodyphus dumicola]XP_035223381.1 ubiquitin-conjugating enzyme E2 J2-like [Stegodyphus dumicola]XP_035223382.1 ubiquitin-conjugating enzyme E2 J2-like [Stegodyphus dumicola]XP_035223383.1 ubiquitin-conjugating enzyme E2 J2-like [Stegodyphus dumicola]
MNKRGNMATRRLRQDYMRIMRDPVPYVKAHPLQQNILEWHFAVLGPDDTPYKGGVYHGKLVFPGEFPFKPPSIYMITPNGRFRCNTRLCLSISDFHPDTWNPAWSVATILTGLLSFMVEKNPTLGSIETSDYEKQLLAARSLEFNLNDPIFCELFPDLVEESRRKINERQLLSTARNIESNTDSSTEVHNSQFQKGQALLSALTNVAVIVGFAAFAYTVRYVLMSIIK